MECPLREIQQTLRVRSRQEEQEWRGVGLQCGEFGDVFEDAGQAEEVVWAVVEV